MQGATTCNLFLKVQKNLRIYVRLKSLRQILYIKKEKNLTVLVMGINKSDILFLLYKYIGIIRAERGLDEEKI